MFWDFDPNYVAEMTARERYRFDEDFDYLDDEEETDDDN